MLLLQNAQTLTGNSNPIDGTVDLSLVHLSHNARPQERQWCCRDPNCLRSNIPVIFHINGLLQDSQLSDSAQGGVYMKKK